MRRRMRIVFMFVLASGMLAGCSKHGVDANGIRFAASAASSSTRTAYSGEGETNTDGALVKERIDWTDGDLISIYCPQAVVLEDESQHMADYVVTSHMSSSSIRSRAFINPVAQSATGMPNGLRWGTGEHHFYAMYPSSNTVSFSTSEKAWIGLYETTMKGTIPGVLGEPSTPSLTWSGLTGAGDIKGVADMRYAWMFAKATAPARAEEVQLDFYPKFTAFEFTVGSGDNPSVTLSTFKLETSTSGVFLSGDFSLDGETGAVTVKNTGASNSISLTFPSGVVVTPEKKLIFTVFTLPVNLTDLKITFTGTEIGTRKLALNTAAGVPLEFDACKKYRITGLRFPNFLTAHGEDIIWDFDVHGENLVWY